MSKQNEKLFFDKLKEVFIGVEIAAESWLHFSKRTLIARAKVAVKVIDMLGEEVIFAKNI
jgi:hypothetical protein